MGGAYVSVKDRIARELISRHHTLRPLLPRGYHAYPGPGGWINLDLRESPMMLARALHAYEKAKVSALRAALKPGMTFVDVGGNKGDFSLIAAKVMGDTGRVLCVEPEPGNAAWIQRSLDRNRYTSVELLTAALADKDGEETLFLGPKSGWHTLIQDPTVVVGELTVKTFTLDGVLAARGLHHVDVIKIDVEGAEDRVLAGATKTFSGDGPMMVLLDIHPPRVDALAICKQLTDWGFTFRDPYELSRPRPSAPDAMTIEVVAIR